MWIYMNIRYLKQFFHAFTQIMLFQIIIFIFPTNLTIVNSFIKLFLFSIKLSFYSLFIKNHFAPFFYVQSQKKSSKNTLSTLFRKEIFFKFLYTFFKYYYQQVLHQMNFNISNSMNFAPIMAFKNENKQTQGQIWCLIISTALKQSVAVYQMQWKTRQNTLNHQISIGNQSGNLSSTNLIDQKNVQDKHSNLLQQNKKSIQKISYNSEILKNDKIEQKYERKQMNHEDKNCFDEHKQLRTACQYPEKKSRKIIHQNQCKQSQSYKQRSLEVGSFIDLYQGAYLPNNHLSNKEIQQKREKLLLRKVFNWKQIDKRIGFRKMQLKKLLG